MFKVLVTTFKALRGMGSGYLLRSSFWPIRSACPHPVRQRRYAADPSVKEFLFGGLQEERVLCPCPGKILLPEAKGAPACVAFWKCPVTWLRLLTWGRQEVHMAMGLVRALKALSCFVILNFKYFILVLIWRSWFR